MYQRIAHINDVSPRHICMLLTKLFCQQIGRLADNHDVVNHCMKAHDISFHVFKRLSLKKIINMLYTLINMPKTVYVSNGFSHK